MSGLSKRDLAIEDLGRDLGDLGPEATAEGVAPDLVPGGGHHPGAGGQTQETRGQGHAHLSRGPDLQ